MKIDSEDEEDAQDLSMQSFPDQFKAFLLLCSRLYLGLSASWFISLLQAFGWQRSRYEMYTLNHKDLHKKKVSFRPMV